MPFVPGFASSVWPGIRRARPAWSGAVSDSGGLAQTANTAQPAPLTLPLRPARSLLAASAVLSATLALYGVWAPHAQADPGAPFSAISGSVNAGDQDDQFSGAPLGSGFSNVVVETSQTGASQVQFDARFETEVGSGDVVWSPAAEFDAGDTPSFDATDDDDTNGASVSAEFFSVPYGPVSYSGVTSTQSGESELPFMTLGDAPYVANVTVSGGAVSVGGGTDNSQTFESSGQESLGEVSSGGGDVTVSPVSGPQTQWTVSITPLPIVLSGVALNHSVAQPGVINTLHFSTDGSTNVSATITNSSGVDVRTLASGLAENSGANTLVWDGRNSAGNSVPTGMYAANVTSTDPLGNVSTGSAQIEIDSTPPTADLETYSVRPTQAVRVKFDDVGSGVASASIQIGSVRRTLPANEHTISYAPKRWTIGRHTLIATVRDLAGNKTTQSFTFTVRGKKLVVPPHTYSLINCPRRHEQDAVASTKFTPGGCAFADATGLRLLATLGERQNRDITVRYQHKDYGLICRGQYDGELESCSYKGFLVVRLYLDSAEAPRNYRFPTRT
jgi:hypothetical protein